MPSYYGAEVVYSTLAQDTAILAVSAADVEAVIKEQGSWCNVKEEINIICKGSAAGQALFGFAYTNVVCEAVTKCIEDELTGLKGKHLDVATAEKWEGSVSERHGSSCGSVVPSSQEGDQAQLQGLQIGRAHV